MAVDRIDYSLELGRTYDIDMIRWEDDVEGEAQFTLGNLSKKTTGIVKSVNKFVLILLTLSGSDPFFPERGTQFDEIMAMGGEDEQTIGSFAQEQVSSAIKQIKSIQSNSSIPEDERLIGAQVTNVAKVSADKISISISLSTEAGEGVSIKVPIIGG